MDQEFGALLDVSEKTACVLEHNKKLVVELQHAEEIPSPPVVDVAIETVLTTQTARIVALEAMVLNTRRRQVRRVHEILSDDHLIDLKMIRSDHRPKDLRSVSLVQWTREAIRRMPLTPFATSRYREHVTGGKRHRTDEDTTTTGDAPPVPKADPLGIADKNEVKRVVFSGLRLGLQPPYPQAVYPLCVGGDYFFPLIECIP
jgi:hypothetical protein